MSRTEGAIMRIIVGSKALSQFDLCRRNPKDLDIHITEDEIIDFKCDQYVIPEDILSLYQTIKVGAVDYATPNTVYTLKCSHFAWDIHWEKTKQDILWLKHCGCELIPELYNELKLYWSYLHGNKDFLSLNKSKEYFFNDFVVYKYDHDYLHELVAFPFLPVYTKCLKDGQDVLIDKSKFDQLTFEEQIRMFREEITVIACERWLLQDRNKISWYQSYLFSLKKTIINLTKNWASDFIILHLDEFINPDYKYFEHLLNTLLENKMSKVDMSIFEEILAYRNSENDYECDMATLIFDMVHEEWGIEKELEKFGYKHIEQEGGGEGGAEYCYGVFQLGEKFYKAEYSYYSHQGYEYDYIVNTLTEVRPQEKLITVYV